MTGRNKDLELVFLAHPWDAFDMGVEEFADELVDLGANGLVFSMTYHEARFAQFCNPKHKFYHSEDAAIYFQPREEFYLKTKVKPILSRMFQAGYSFGAMAEVLKAKGLSISGWIVYYYNRTQCQLHPELAVANCYGDRAMFELCPSNPDVREYAMALTRDICTGRGLEAIMLESLYYHPLDYDYPGNTIRTSVPIPAFESMLLATCFCPACLARSREAGIDGEAVRQTVKEHLDGFFAKEESPLDPHAPLEESTAGLSGLREYLEARNDFVTELHNEVLAIAHSQGVKLIGLIGGPGSPMGKVDWVMGVDLAQVAQLPDIYWLHPAEPSAASVGEALTRARSFAESPKQEYIAVPFAAGFSGPAMTRYEEMLEVFQAAADQGAKGVTFNRYNLLSPSRFRWIKQALREVRGD